MEVGHPSQCNFPIQRCAKKYVVVVASSDMDRPMAINAFVDYIGGIKEYTIFATNQGHIVRKGQVGKHDTGVIMLEEYFLRDLQENTFDFEQCSACNHHFSLPVGIPVTEIHRIPSN